MVISLDATRFVLVHCRTKGVKFIVDQKPSRLGTILISKIDIGKAVLNGVPRIYTSTVNTAQEVRRIGLFGRAWSDLIYFAPLSP